jgi:hypothetical protein
MLYCHARGHAEPVAGSLCGAEADCAMNPADLRAHLVRLLDALEGRACADLSSEYRLRVCASQVRLILARLGETGIKEGVLAEK